MSLLRFGGKDPQGNAKGVNVDDRGDITINANRLSHKLMPEGIGFSDIYNTYENIEEGAWSNYVDANTFVTSPTINTEGYKYLVIQTRSYGTADSITTDFQGYCFVHGTLSSHTVGTNSDIYTAGGEKLDLIPLNMHNTNKGFAVLDVSAFSGVSLRYKSSSAHNATNHIRFKLALTNQKMINSDPLLSEINKELEKISSAITTKQDFLFSAGDVVETYPEGYTGLIAILGHRILEVELNVDTEIYQVGTNRHGEIFISGDSNLFRISNGVRISVPKNGRGEGMWVSDDAVYVSAETSVEKLDRNLDRIWIQSIGAGGDVVDSIFVFNSGEVIAGSRTGAVTKLDADGNILWRETSFTDRTTAVFGDSNGNIYAGGRNKRVNKINENKAGATITDGILEGAVEWWIDTEAVEGNVEGLVANTTGHVTVSGWGSSLRKFDPNKADAIILESGELTEAVLWTFSGHTARINGLREDSAEYLYTSSHDTTVRKIDKDGNEVWVFNDQDDWVLALDVKFGKVISATFWEGDLYVISDEMVIKGFRNI